MTRKMNTTFKAIVKQANNSLRHLPKEQADVLYNFITAILIENNCYHGFNYYDVNTDGSLYLSSIGSVKQFYIV